MITEIATWEERPTEIETVEEVLSDSSKVYAVKITQGDNVIQLDCLDENNAHSLHVALMDIMDRRTVNDYRNK
jgi:hypothetical protein